MSRVFQHSHTDPQDALLLVLCGPLASLAALLCFSTSCITGADRQGLLQSRLLDLRLPLHCQRQRGLGFWFCGAQRLPGWRGFLLVAVSTCTCVPMFMEISISASPHRPRSTVQNPSSLEIYYGEIHLQRSRPSRVNSAGWAFEILFSAAWGGFYAIDTGNPLGAASGHSWTHGDVYMDLVINWFGSHIWWWKILYKRM